MFLARRLTTFCTLILLYGDVWIACAFPVELLPSDIMAGDGLSPTAIEGDIIAIGAPGHDESGEDTGSVYVYRRVGSQWLNEQKLSPNDGRPGAFFGAHLAIAEGVIFVGATGDDEVADDAGAVYVFRYDGNNWTEEQKLVASDGSPLDNFGTPIRATGQLIVVAATGSNGDEVDSGAAYVFRKNGSHWTEEQKLMPSVGSPSGWFGAGIAIGDNAIAIGAPLADDRAEDSGVVYVFRFDGDTWVQVQMLNRTGAAANDQFGFGASFLEGVLLIGSPLADDYDVDAGLVSVFTFDGSNWTESVFEEIFPPLVADPYGYFGTSLFASGKRVVIGASGSSQFGQYVGAAYVYQRSGGWQLEATLGKPSGAIYDGFGYPVRISGSYVVVGASGHDGRGVDAGGVYVFPIPDCNDNGVLDELDTAQSSDCNGNGEPDDCEADCNDNGIADDCDIASGTSRDCNEDGWPDECQVAPSCAACGDCNQNGVPDECDVRMGRSGDCAGNLVPDECEPDCDNNGIADSCEALEAMVLSAPDEAPGQGFGSSVAVEGDVIFVGAEADNERGEVAGAVYVCRRSHGEWSVDQKLLAHDGGTGSQFGRAVAVAGEIAAIGAPGSKGVYVFRRRGLQWILEQKVEPPDNDSSGFGESVAISGSALLAGDSFAVVGNAQSGTVYVFQFDGVRWAPTQRLYSDGLSSSARFGKNLAVSGNRVLVGAAGDDGACLDEEGAHSCGAAYLFRSDGSHWQQEQKLTPFSSFSSESFGQSVRISNETVLIGKNSGGYYCELGAAIPFHHEGRNWFEEDELRPCEERGVACIDRSFGEAVALNDEYAAVSEIRNSENFSIYLYRRKGPAWTVQTQLAQVAFPCYHGIRGGLAISQGTLVVGVPWYGCTGDGQSHGSGRVLIYDLDRLSMGLDGEPNSQDTGAVACGQCGAAAALGLGVSLLGLVGMRARFARGHTKRRHT